MERTVYFICGHPIVAEKVATCTAGNYKNFAKPSKTKIK